MADVRDASAVSGVIERLEGEAGRRLVHASGAVIPSLYVLAGLEWRWIQVGLLGCVALVCVLEVVRLRVGLDWWIFEHLTRDYEETTVAGYALYAVGVATVAFAFDPTVAVPAMYMLAVADPVGGVLGGSEPVRVKPASALGGAFVVCVVVGLPFLPPGAAVAAAGAASLADGIFLEIRGRVIDDNLSIPIAAAVAAWVVLVIGGA